MDTAVAREGHVEEGVEGSGGSGLVHAGERAMMEGLVEKGKEECSTS